MRTRVTDESANAEVVSKGGWRIKCKEIVGPFETLLMRFFVKENLKFR